MKKFKLSFHFLLPLLFLFPLLFSNVYAETLPHTDDFESGSADGWSYDYGDDNELELRDGHTSHKTFDFGVADANKTVKVSFEIDARETWEESGGGQDFLYTTFNDTDTRSFSQEVDGYTVTYFATLSATGTLKISFNVDTNDGEYVELDNVTITDDLTSTIGGREFEERTQHILFGDIEVIGNTVLCILSGGVCQEPTTTNSNSGTDLQKAPHSYSTLDIPTAADVVYARIYWQGRKAASTSNLSWDTTSKSTASKIKIRKNNNATFTELTADVKDFDFTSSNSYYIRTYSASADASSVVDSNGTYHIDTASFDTYAGNSPDGLGAYGAWVLVVIYDDPNETKARNITIFDGYKQVTSSTGDINIGVDGFLTPKSNDVDSKTYVFTAEGDKYISGDVIKMAGKTYNTTLSDIGTFDSRVDVLGTRSPNLSNNNGIDIHRYDTGTTTGGLGIINNDETGAKFQFTSTQDTYFPSVIAFSTELYLPKLCYDYSIKQDGQYLAIDRSLYPVARLDSRVSSSDLEITVYLRNQEADIIAEGIALKADVNNTIFKHVGNIHTSNVNGSALIDRGTPDSSSTLCDYDINGDNSLSNNGCTNGHDIRKGNGDLDAQEYIYTKYSLEPSTVSGISVIDEPLGLSLKYYITANGNKIEYPDYELGGPNVPLCIPSYTYSPTWGQFNVIQSASTTNNINTQISRKPFDAAVIFDSTPGTGDNAAPTSNINTTVLVEIIDIDAFGDINASCPNPDASRSTPIVVPINFTNSDYQTNIPVQTNDYYNFAVKNAAFRTWYFNDNNNTLIQNWTANTSDNGKTVNSISGLYNSAAHTECLAECSANDTTVTCFDCIKTNYAEPLCSRDNFSIRPESYDLRLYDIDQSLPTYNVITDPTNTKNTTKSDLSNLYQYSPSYATPTQRIDLAAGYYYRFDVMATGNDGISKVPGYTRYFNGGSDYNATLLWDSTNTCPDTSNEDLVLYVANGEMLNLELEHTQVGEYQYNIIDNSWTAADWQNISHHNVNDSFASGADCIQNSTTSTLTGGQHGCDISSNHPNGGASLTYKDLDLTFHPYQFTVTNAMTLSTANIIPSIPPNAPGPFVYMANISSDENMSVHLSTTITARGKNDPAALSNFVTGCYSKPLNLQVTKTGGTNTLSYSYKANNLDINGSTVNTLGVQTIQADQNVTFNTPNTYFQYDQNGTMQLRTNLNYDRNTSQAVNPEDVNFTIISANDSASLFNADLIINKTTEGNVTVNQNVLHYYGRTAAKDATIICDAAVSPCVSGTDDDDVYVYYEVFCNGTGCDKTLLPTDLSGNTLQKVDSRWFINLNHNSTDYGGITSITNPRVTVASIDYPDNNYTVRSVHSYDMSAGLPYTAIMTDAVPSWLIYDESNAAASFNTHNVLYRPNVEWSGKHEADSKTKTKIIQRVNRRTMW